MANGVDGTKWLPTQKPNTCYRDLTDALGHTICTNEYGWAEFQCPTRNTSVWVEETKYQQLIDEL